MNLERVNPVYSQPVISEERLLQIAQFIDIGFSVVLWLTYFLAIMASFQHVAWAFSLLEAGNQAWVGYLAAAAVDGALAVMAYLIQQRRRQRHVLQELGEPETAVEGTAALWVGLFFLGGISIIANFLHGAHIELNTETMTWASLLTLDGLQWLRLIANAIALPLIVIYLGEVVSVPGANGVISDLVRRNKVLQETAHLVDIVRTELDSTKTKLSEAIIHLEISRTELDTTEQELNPVRTALDKAEVEACALRTSLTESENGLNTTRAELNTAKAELLRTQTDLNTIQAEVTSLRAELHKKEAALSQTQTALADLKQLINIISIPAQETIQYLISQAAGGDDTQEAAAGRASERLGKPISRSLIGRTARILRMDEA